MRKLLALFLFVCLIFPLVLATLVTTSVSSWVLDRSFYVDLLDNPQLYEAIISKDLPSYFKRQFADQIDSDLPPAAFGAALREVVTPEYLRDQTLRVVDNVFDALEGRSTTLDLTLDTAPIKAALAGPGGQRFAQTLAAQLPNCAPGQESATGSQIIACRPTDMSVEEATTEILTALPAFIAQVPDRIDLSRNSISFRRDMRFLNYGLLGADALNLAILILIAFSGSLWLGTAFIGGVDRRERLMWLGWMLIVPAVLVFFMGLLINGDFSLNWVRLGLDEARLGNAAYSETFRLALLDVSRTALNTVSNGFLSVGAVSAAIGFALVAWSRSTPSELRPAPVTVYPPSTPPPVYPAQTAEPPASPSGQAPSA